MLQVESSSDNEEGSGHRSQQLASLPSGAFPVDEDTTGQSPKVSTAQPSGIAAALAALHFHILSRPTGKLVVLLGSLLTALVALSAAGRISVGLEQTVALPRDSYLQDYYRCGKSVS